MTGGSIARDEGGKREKCVAGRMGRMGPGGGEPGSRTLMGAGRGGDGGM